MERGRAQDRQRFPHFPVGQQAEARCQETTTRRSKTSALPSAWARWDRPASSLGDEAIRQELAEPLLGSEESIVKPPVFVVSDDGSLIVFQTAEDAGAYMEAIDVLNGEYRDVFDADGIRLRPIAESHDASVQIIEPPDARPEREVLASYLRNHLASLKRDPAAAARAALDGCSFEDLIQAALAAEGRWQMRRQRSIAARVATAVDRLLRKTH